MTSTALALMPPIPFAGPAAVARAARGLRRLAFPWGRSHPLNRSLTGARIALAGSGHTKIAAVPGLVVHARSGSLWVTQHRDRHDHLVHAGARFVADRAGPMVIAAFRWSEVELEWPPANAD